MSKLTFDVQSHRWDADAETSGSDHSAYSIEAPESLDGLDFEPRPMVAWYSPKELFVAGFRAVVSAIFGAYADKREIEAVLAQPTWHDYSPQLEQAGELWIDYVADLGDGWAPTYAIARLLAEESLAFDENGRAAPGSTDPARVTRRGHVLIMGGDQVYPTASPEEYRNRLVGPYRSALPGVAFADDAPHLFAIPGNHDWYDGLGSFFNLFCRQRWIGGWRTQQTRSYFAFRLGAGLWVWGIDIQLSANIDQPQLDYFDGIATTEMREGSSIILCTAEPSWAYVEMDTWQERNEKRRERLKEHVYKNLGHLEKTVIEKKSHSVIVALAGDAHNYARYEQKSSGQQRFVAGGGGASLFPTHNMPESLHLPKKYGGHDFDLKKVFPEARTSRKLARKTVRFPMFRQNWGLSAFIGAFYLLIAWVVQSVSKIRSGDTPGITLLDRLADGPDVSAFIAILAHSPGSVAFLVVLMMGYIAFSGFQNTTKKILHGLTHTIAHVVVFFLLLSAFAMLNLGLLKLDVDYWVQVVLFGFQMLFFGGLVGGFVFGLYLWLSNRFLRLHDNEVLLGQSDPDYKHFLRLRIRSDGTITIFPVGVEKVPRRRGWSADSVRRSVEGWAFMENASGSQAWFEPVDGPIQKHAHLVEEPVTVSFGVQDRDSE